MVVKSYYAKQMQQHKWHQLHRQEHEQEQPTGIISRRRRPSVSNYNPNGHFYCSAFLKYKPHVVNSRNKLPSTGSGRRSGYSGSSTAFILLVISLLNAFFVGGASVNAALEDDLLINSNYGGSLTITTNAPSVENATSASTNNATTPQTIANGTTFTTVDNAQVNHTQAAPTPSVIANHGSLIYQVIQNPIFTPSAAKMGQYRQMTATVYGFRVEDAAKGVSYKDGASVILANSQAVIRFFGVGFTNNTIIRFVTEEGARGADCDDVSSTKYFHFDNSQISDHAAVATVQLPPLDEGEKFFYLCIREDNIEMPWIHQGTEEWIVLTTYNKWIPVWAHIIMLVVLLTLSGLFSGLNLGLMAIDRTELKIIMNAGTEKEKRYAKQIRPLRENGNYLLCSLLLGNVLVNATLTILLDDLTSGLIAVIGSTVGIVIFGEIVPQAVCSRHGLAVGAKTVWITKLFMAITFPLSYPISVILDKALGEELGNVYNRARLKELILVTQGTNDLEKDEVNIISGALELKQKTVAHVMTRLEDVYMLPIDAILDFDTVSEIMSNGYSRIPVYEKTRGNVISLLYARDLAFVDADDKMPLRSICEFYDNPCHFVFENTTLDVLFKTFKQGNKGHMAFVHRVKTNDKSDPVYEVIGLVTMEDVIEELIQEEINDETDIGGPEHKKRSRGRYNSIAEVAIGRFRTDGVTVSAQLTFAAFQYLSTAVDEFNDTRISKTVLERLLKQSIYFHLKIKNKDTMKTDASTILYERGKPADYFIMILEGKVYAEIGKENLIFESGPFSYFGTNSLSLSSAGDTSLPLEYRKSSPDTSLQSITAVYIPDYNVRAVTDLTYVKISRSMYIAAKQATVFEKSYSTTDHEYNTDKIDEQLQKHLLEEGKRNSDTTMEKSLAMTTPADICEKLQESNDERNVPDIVLTQPHHLHHQLHQQPDRILIGDNNNICLNTGNNFELQEKQEELSRSNLSRVIICPKDDKSDPLPEATFQGKLIVDGDDNLSCKL